MFSISNVALNLAGVSEPWFQFLLSGRVKCLKWTFFVKYMLANACALSHLLTQQMITTITARMTTPAAVPPTPTIIRSIPDRAVSTKGVRVCTRVCVC